MGSGAASAIGNVTHGDTHATRKHACVELGMTDRTPSGGCTASSFGGQGLLQPVWRSTEKPDVGDLAECALPVSCAPFVRDSVLLGRPREPETMAEFCGKYGVDSPVPDGTFPDTPTSLQATARAVSRLLFSTRGYLRSHSPRSSAGPQETTCYEMHVLGAAARLRIHLHPTSLLHASGSGPGV